jgi:isopentenyl diphosphate isomerase/L-lactate dehydrogenase-like FMN-dependent dehydrogenase
VIGERWRRDAHNIADLRRMAKRVLPRPIFDFADGGAGDEHTLRRNEQAFDDMALLPRPLRGAAERDLGLELFGRPISMPIIIGPTGLAGLFWPDGEQAAARAAAAAGTAYCLSHGSVCALEVIPAGETPRWMQVFIYRDRGFTRELAARAAACGYDALVLTVDNQLLGRRERDLRNGFAIPPRYRARDALALATKLPWLMRMRRELPRITFGNYVRPDEAARIEELASRMARLLDPAMSWADVDALRSIWTGPLIGHHAPTRGARGRGARRRRRRGLEPRRPSARRRRSDDRGAAGGRGCGRRTCSSAARRRHPPGR